MNIANARAKLLYLLFFFSGIPALFYQLIWQRSLFAIYGVSIEAITMVVAAFMLGLGLGSLMGGWLSVKAKNHLLKLFGIGELLIGIFGYLSLHFFAWIGAITLNVTSEGIFVITFLLVCIPTLVMGATLPILVAYNTRNEVNLGNNVGGLYFANTFGSAIACLLAAFWAMKTLGQQGVVTTAAMINIVIGMGALLISTEAQTTSSEQPLNKVVSLKKPEIKFAFAILLAALTGYIALSYEIVWARVYAFSTANSAPIYTMFLATYLMGLAFGSLLSRSFCTFKVMPVFFVTLLLSCVMGFLSLPFIATLQVHASLYASFTWLELNTALFGVSLPLLSFSAIDSNTSAGRKMSYLYLANIIGATVGILITGLVLADTLTLQNINLFLSCCGLSLVFLLLFNLKIARNNLWLGIIGVALLASTMWWSTPYLYQNFYEKLLYKNKYHQNISFQHVIENKSGIIAVTPNGTVFGNGIYDGMFSISLIHDKNLIARPFALSAFHPDPQDVLMVGLSSGTWAQVLANNPYVKNLTIVEINPGYLKLIPQYSVVASLLKNPKVHIVIADGRRWLLQNKNRKFDLIVMNTTWNWREYASDVLSTDFLQMVRHSLKPQGILFYNTTFSSRVMRTGLLTYPYALRFTDFLLVSDSPITVNKARLNQVLAHYTIDGKRILNLENKADQQKLQQLLALLNIEQEYQQNWYSTESKADLLKRLPIKPLITDNNMGTEWWVVR